MSHCLFPELPPLGLRTAVLSDRCPTRDTLDTHTPPSLLSGVVPPPGTPTSSHMLFAFHEARLQGRSLVRGWQHHRITKGLEGHRSSRGSTYNLLVRELQPALGSAFPGPSHRPPPTWAAALWEGCGDQAFWWPCPAPPALFTVHTFTLLAF